MTGSGALASWAVDHACDLVNSWDTTCAGPPEQFPDLAAYTRYLRQQGHDEEAAAVQDADLPALWQLRDQLRPVFEGEPAQQLVAVEEALSRHVAGVRLDVQGEVVELRPVPREASYGGQVAARAAYALARVAADGDLGRLRACADADCNGVLVDLTRPATRRFCCSRCTTRATSTAYRERRRHALA